ncbi:hypothetical protein RQN30_02795 [Arcanobacterium hippocoleae]
MLAFAIVIAIGEWFGLKAPAINFLHHIAAGIFGVLAVVVPLLLTVLSIKFFCGNIRRRILAGRFPR